MVCKLLVEQLSWLPTTGWFLPGATLVGSSFGSSSRVKGSQILKDHPQYQQNREYRANLPKKVPELMSSHPHAQSSTSPWVLKGQLLSNHAALTAVPTRRDHAAPCTSSRVAQGRLPRKLWLMAKWRRGHGHCNQLDGDHDWARLDPELQMQSQGLDPKDD